MDIFLIMFFICITADRFYKIGYTAAMDNMRARGLLPSKEEEEMDDHENKSL